MKITSSENNKLVIQTSVIIAYIIGGILLTTGIIVSALPKLSSEFPSYIIGIVLIIAGLLTIIIPPKKTITLDKNNKTCTLTLQRLWLKKTDTTELKNIQKITFKSQFHHEVRHTEDGVESSNMIYFNIIFNLAGGNELKLYSTEHGTNPGLGNIWVEKEKAKAAQIADFLGIPFETVG